MIIVLVFSLVGSSGNFLCGEVLGKALAISQQGSGVGVEEKCCAAVAAEDGGRAGCGDRLLEGGSNGFAFSLFGGEAYDFFGGA